MKFFSFWVLLFLSHSFLFSEALETEGPLRSPYHSLDFFYQQTKLRNYSKAKEAMEFPSSVSEEEQESDAEKLKYLLDRFLWIDWDSLPKSTEGTNVPVRLGAIPLGERSVPITLHSQVKGEERVWKISKASVNAIEILYQEYHPPTWKRWIPESISELGFLGLQSWQWIGLAAVFLIASLFSLVFEAVFYFFGKNLLMRSSFGGKEFLLLIRKPARLFWFAVIAMVLKQGLDLAYSPGQFLQSLLNGVLIFSFLWFFYKSLDLFSSFIERKLSGGHSEDGDIIFSQEFKTSSIVLRRTLKIILILIGMSVLFMQFDAAKKIGMSLLASAGLAGLALGLAAQKTLGTIFAGIQLILTQPVRIGDSVVIEKEYGLVEEIRFTYIVIRTWDLRRLIIPISYFLEKPFENWSKIDPETIGVVLLYVSYQTPLERLKEEASGFVLKHPLFSKTSFGVQVTETSPDHITVQITASGKTPSETFQLKVELREYMVAFLRTWEEGKYLP
ncbi:mechanosensitive ion channel family protein [Leptospira idonii]|uniref:Mechanosensitive ion channel family protein n=1 Tax=Leptospira idonii TaxID=1193500 RepID=A0A4R9LYQ2_9LEPT|nr:mechanosensitive ion channel family protein [Leptospira idonii]TGN19450.1 mechanosensitive ion channel family protein [Leptospira idonii]